MPICNLYCNFANIKFSAAFARQKGGFDRKVCFLPLLPSRSMRFISSCFETYEMFHFEIPCHFWRYFCRIGRKTSSNPGLKNLFMVFSHLGTGFA